MQDHFDRSELTAPPQKSFRLQKSLRERRGGGGGVGGGNSKSLFPNVFTRIGTS